MTNYELISDYRDIDTYKESFNELAQTVFKLDFKSWYENGCWNDHYICYSYLDRNKVIANASINKMTFVCNGTEYNAIQIGTVMTHPDYRNQGLSGKLITHIIEKYEQEYDFIYLFANESVLDFYSKYGFSRLQESSFSLNMSGLALQPAASSSPRKLETSDIDDFRLMEKFAAERIPVSPKLGVKDNEHLLMFYFVVALQDMIYYIEELDVIVLFKEEERQLHIYDIISKQKVNYDMLLPYIITANTEVIHFYFTPDCAYEQLQQSYITEAEDTLFVRPFFDFGEKHFIIPLTSHS
ncbi:GNAT family N-acetyltransferase [Paenibacillus taiwanensis]|uniref:GNAT family N-acetyltransferase n=1 Tax=Paenibacillus taiwanensis TaxID=401638 RepID=UPI00048D5AEE|nr:GNAT family N-acetyltransferase [Paenibacillus taiwanensis]